MLQICFIMCQNFSKEVAELQKYWKFIRNICLRWYQNLFLNFEKLEKFKNEKIVPKSCFFVSLPSDSWQIQKQLMTNSETHLGFKLLGNHYYTQINRNLRTKKRVVSPSLSYLHDINNSISEISLELLKILFKTSGMLPCHNLRLYVRTDI